MKLLPGKNSDKILWILQHRPIFLCGWTVCHDQKQMADAKRMTTSTMCHDEPKFYVNLVNFSVECVSTKHTI